VKTHREMQGKYRIIALLLLPVFLVLFVSCHGGSADTSGSTTIASQTYTGTVGNFIGAAQERLVNGLTCGDTVYQSFIVGISADDFLSIYIQDDTTLLMNGEPYLYEAVPMDSDPLFAIVDIGDYEAIFSDPNPSVTSTGGARQFSIQVYRGEELVSEFSYVQIWMQIFPNAADIVGYDVDELLVLFMYYRPDCDSSYEKLWLVLLPVP